MSKSGITEMIKGPKKTYVLDTTVLIYDPDIMFRTGESDWVIPLAVIREIDGLKNSDKELVAKSSRQIARTLDRLGSYGNLSTGVKLPTGKTLRVLADYEKMDALDSDADNRILGTAILLKNAGEDVTIFTTDINMRTIARICGIKAEYLPLLESEKLPSIPLTTSARRGKLSPKRKRLLKMVYRGGILLIAGFSIVAVIGIFGSLSGFKGPLWRISEFCGYMGISLLIAIIVLYSAATRGTIYDGYSSDIVVNPVYKDYDINIFHEN